MLKRYLKKIIYIVLVIFLAFFIIKKHLYYSPPTTITLPSNINFQNGDIILRKESNSISDIFATINKLNYSHIGTILIQDKKIKIIHIEDNNQKNDFKISEFKDFITYASSYAIYRPKNKTDKDKLISSVKNIKNDNPKFDMDFSADDSDNKLYCTELAFMLYNESVEDKLEEVKDKYLNYSFIPLRIFTDMKKFSLIYEKEEEKVD